MKGSRRAALAAAIAGGLALAASGAWAEPAIAVKLKAGPAYLTQHWFGPVPAKMAPQAAIWLETAAGKYVDTIFVTKASAAEGWKAAGGARRPEALPLWSHARGVKAADGLFMPERSHPLPDAISGATSKAGFTRSWAIPASLPAGSYVLKVELNASYDWNAAYPDKLPKGDARYSLCNGQPSLLWAAAIELGGPAASAVLAPIGTGALNGEDGSLRPGLEGITTAKDIVASIEAEYRP